MTTVSDKPSQVNEHESQPPSFSKEWLLNFYKDDLFKPNNLNLIPYATLKSPCPPVNLMDQEQLMSYNYQVLYPENENFGQKRYSGRGGRGRGRYPQKFNRFTSNEESGFGDKNKDLSSIHWRKEKKSSSTIETPLTYSDLENDDNIKDEPWIIDDTLWLPSSDITINRDIVDSDSETSSKKLDETPTKPTIPVNITGSFENEQQEQQKEQFKRHLKPFQFEQFEKEDILHDLIQSPSQQPQKPLMSQQIHPLNQQFQITQGIKNLNIQPKQTPFSFPQSPQQKIPQQAPLSPLHKITQQNIPQQLLQPSQTQQSFPHMPQSPHHIPKSSQLNMQQSNMMFSQFNPFSFQTQSQQQPQPQMGFDSTRKSPIDFTQDLFMPLSSVNPEEKIWYYKDPKNNVHGPFSGIEMNDWLTKGYFNSDLMVSRGSSEFRQLYDLFLSELRNCFTGMPLVQFLQQLPNNHMFKINLLHIFAMKQSLVQSPFNMSQMPNVPPTQQHMQPLQNQSVVPPLMQSQQVQQTQPVVPPLQQTIPKQQTPTQTNVVPPPQQVHSQQKSQQKTENIETKQPLPEKVENTETQSQQMKVTPSNVKESAPAPKRNVPSLYEIQQEELRRKEREMKEQELKNKEKLNRQERVKKTAWTTPSKQPKAKSLKEIQQEELEKKQNSKVVIEESIPMTKPSLNAWGRPPVTKKQPMSLIEIQNEELKSKQNNNHNNHNNNNNNSSQKDSTTAENFWDYNPESEEPKKSNTSTTSTTPGPYLQRAKKGKKQVNPSDIGLIITSAPKKEVIVIDENDDYDV